jgi:hypothetical protein
MPQFRTSSAVFALLISGFLLGLANSEGSFALPSGISMAELAGRWRDDERNLLLDLTTCGERICGRLVESDGQCGRTALNLEQDTHSSDRGLSLKGEIDLAETEGVFHTVAWVQRRPKDSALDMRLRGWSGSGDFVMRRHYPFNAYLVRIGEPVCPPGPIS